jgi:N-dimethylarginine dimethylaminohydrolase
MSGADEFGVLELNPYSDASIQPDVAVSMAEHTAIKAALEAAGVTVKQVEPPVGCQDGVYTANWALVRGDTAVLASLPGPRQSEQPYARKTLEKLGLAVIEAPYRFSGQGDALPLGNRLFTGSHYRTDPRMHQFLADTLGYEVISLETVPATDEAGHPVTNKITGWPDSFFYDIDLALSILRDDLIAWCPQAFTAESQAKIRGLTDLDKIEVDYDEAVQGFACNLVSTGQTVIMSAHAPKYRAAIEAHGLTTVSPTVIELAKGGGYIRCTTLTL